MVCSLLEVCWGVLVRADGSWNCRYACENFERGHCVEERVWEEVGRVGSTYAVQSHPVRVLNILCTMRIAITSFHAIVHRTLKLEPRSLDFDPEPSPSVALFRNSYGPPNRFHVGVEGSGGATSLNHSSP